METEKIFYNPPTPKNKKIKIPQTLKSHITGFQIQIAIPFLSFFNNVMGQLLLAQIEFAYIQSTSQTTGLSPF